MIAPETATTDEQTNTSSYEAEEEKRSETSPLLLTVKPDESGLQSETSSSPLWTFLSFLGVHESLLMIIFYGANSVFAISLFMTAIIPLFCVFFPFVCIGLFFVVILGMTGGGLLGARIHYRVSNMGEMIDNFKEETNKQEMEISYLKITKGKLKSETEKIRKSVQGLQEARKELDAHLKEMDDLRQSLTEIVGEHESIGHMLDSLNGQFEEMESIMEGDEVAHLLSVYYDIQFRDGDQGMDREEYQRFKARLSRKTRECFESIGFEKMAGWDGSVDVKEMTKTIKQVIKMVHPTVDMAV